MVCFPFRSLASGSLVLLFGLFASLAVSAQEGQAIIPDCWDKSPTVRVCLVKRTSVPIIDLRVDIPAGSTYEPADKAGLASMVRHLMSRETTTLSEEALLGAIDDTGAIIGGGVDWDRASFTLRTLSDPTIRDKAVHLLAGILKSPSFSNSIFEREKGRVITALREEMKSPKAVASKAYYQAIYPNHPYGQLPSIETVGALQQADLWSFYQQYYQNGRMTISIVGDIDRQGADQIASQLIINRQNTATDVTIPALTPLAKSETLQRPISSKQSHVLIGMPVMEKGDPDFFTLTVANQIFGGGGMLSRLMTEVREKQGLVYGINSDFTTAKQPGPFTIHFQVEADKTQQALTLTQKLYQDFVTEGPTEEEVERAKKYLVSSLPLQFESNRSVLSVTSTIAFYGLPVTWVEDYRQKIEAVTREQVKDALKRRLQNQPMVTVVAGQS